MTSMGDLPAIIDYEKKYIKWYNNDTFIRKDILNESIKEAEQ